MFSTKEVTEVFGSKSILIVFFILLVIFSIIFRYKESVFIKEKQLILSLAKSHSTIPLQSVTSVKLDEHCNNLQIQVAGAKYSFKLFGFKRRKLELLLTNMITK
jgi:hypothetical protein